MLLCETAFRFHMQHCYNALALGADAIRKQFVAIY